MGEMFEAGSWNVDMEVNLFHAMRGHKPVGVNRHFHMVVIHDKLSSPATKKLTAKNVWDHLSTMYDLQALNESEILPFPNKPVDFDLPNRDYKQICEEEFPRMLNVGSPVAEEPKTKPEGQAKGGKSSRSDSKTPQASRGSAEPRGSASKCDSKSATPAESKSSSSKAESKSSSSSSGKGEGKGGGKSAQSSSHTPSSDPSPKRMKRTRHNVSASNSPASDTPPAKRRR